MATGEVVGILPPPSYRHRKQPSAPTPTQDQQQQQQQQQQQRQETDVSLPKSAAAGSGRFPSVPQTAATTTTVASSSNPAASGGLQTGDLSPRQSSDLSYMHRPPTILPNYGKRSRGSVLPKSNVSRVLLYDNLTQQTMLDVRINSIRSQSYKTNRELDMHMKSFISRRKAREKALKKITRVQHMDDYVEFIQEQEPATISFPGIGIHKTAHKKLITSARSMPSLSTLGNQRRVQGKSQNSYIDGKFAGLNAGASRENSLPRITVSSQSDDRMVNGMSNTKLNNNNNNSSLLPEIHIPSALQDDDENDDNDDNNSNNDVIRSRKVGVHFVKGDKGITRVFKVETENSDIATPEKTPRDESSPQQRHTVAFVEPLNERDNLDENNNSPTTPDHNEPTPTPAKNTMPHLQPRKSIFQLQKEKEQEEELLKIQENDLKRHRSSLSDIPVDLHPEKPIIDSRFLHLRRLLVPQNPPNEGFAELSPTFPKRYPSLKDLSPRSRRKKYVRKRGGGRYSNDDDDDDEDDEENEEVGYLTDNSDDEDDEY